MHRVAITGIGVVSALGQTTSDFWRSLREGRSGIAPIESVDRTKLRFQNVAEVRSYDHRAYFDDKRANLMDRFAQFAVVAAREAVRDAGVERNPDLLENTAVITGTCVGGQRSEDASYVDLYQLGRNRVHPLTIPRAMATAGASHISMELGVTGPSLTISTACSSATHAIGLAFWWVRAGSAKVAITGGSEAPFSLGFLKAWDAMRVVSPDTCRPFSRDRRGIILGEGSAILVLEPLEAARDRGVRIHGEVLGFGMSSDAHHLTQPSAGGAASAMRSALRDAAIGSNEVGYINAHGTASQSSDPTETAAIRAVFGSHADRLAVSSTKSMHGHALGAAGALEAAATIMSLREGIIPPTANYNEPDPACDLDVVPNVARPVDIGYAVSNSFAFGGSNAALVFRRLQVCKSTFC